MTDVRPIDANALMDFARNHVNRTVDSNDIARFPTLDYVPRQQWISVKDRLPEETEIVLWFDGGSMDIGHVFRSRGVTFVSTWQDIFNIDEYTHWMPLPEPPKEE